MPPTLFFSIKIASAIQFLLQFCINFWIIFSLSLKNASSKRKKNKTQLGCYGPFITLNVNIYES